MRFLAITTLVLLASAVQAAPPELKDNRQKASYIIGNNIGENIAADFKDRGFNVDPAIVVQGILNGLQGKESGYSEEEAQAVIKAFLEEAQAQLKKSGVDFLAQNKTKEGVQTTKSGLQYKVIKEGAGASPKPTSVVTVHYRGTLIDGTEFDSSYARMEPASFPVNGVIAGWTEALQLMKPGSKYELYIPSDLAYGAQPPGRSPIPPHAVLLFTVELLDVKEGQSQPQFQPQR